MITHPYLTLSILLTVVFSGAGYVAWVLVDSYLATQQTKKIEMVICPVHGAIPREYTASFMDVPFCLKCWSTKWDSAKRVLK